MNNRYEDRRRGKTPGREQPIPTFFHGLLPAPCPPLGGSRYLLSGRVDAMDSDIYLTHDPIKSQGADRVFFADGGANSAVELYTTSL